MSLARATDSKPVRGLARSICDMNWQDRIDLDPAVLTGKPVIRGTRIAVDFVLGLLGQGWSEADIIRNYPGISHEDIAACLLYATEILQSERVYPAAIA